MHMHIQNYNNKMLQLLYALIFGEMLVIMCFLFKTPARKLVVITLDRMKRGRGPLLLRTLAASFLIMLASSLSSSLHLPNHLLHSSLLGFVLFLSLVIDRLHHYIRELRVMRRAIEAARKQSRSLDGKSVSAVEHKALMEEIATLKPKMMELEYECEVKESKVKALEAEVEALRKQSEAFLVEYDRLLAENQNRGH